MTVRFPTTGAIAGDLYGMVLRELTLCKATSEETVVIFTDTRTNTNYAAAFLAAAKEVAASAFEIKIPLLPGTAGGETNVAPVVEILKTAQLVVDLTTGGVLYLYSKRLADVLSGGTRVLQVRGTEDQLKRCFPDEGVRLRTLNGAQRLEQAGRYESPPTPARTCPCGRTAGAASPSTASATCPDAGTVGPRAFSTARRSRTAPTAR